MRMAVTARMDTRGNILEVSLGLFNERSPAQVTTAEIAAAAGIAEGNLHYHFRRKADLLVALFDMFEAEAMAAAVFELEPDDAPLTAYVDYQRKWFRLMWAHRWFYRDAASLYSLAPALRLRVRTLAIRAQDLARVYRTRFSGHKSVLMRLPSLRPYPMRCVRHWDCASRSSRSATPRCSERRKCARHDACRRCSGRCGRARSAP